MDHLRGRVLFILGVGGLWAILWPAIGLAVMVVLTVAWGPNSSDIGVPEFLAILGRLGLPAGIIFGAVVVILEAQRALGMVVLIRLLAYGVMAAVLTGIVAGLQPSAILNACVLGGVSGPVSIVVARAYAERRSLRI
jgi:hypothetical protein